jgi:hypothetical protein
LLFQENKFGYSIIAMKPHPTLSKGEGFKMLFKVSPFGGDLEGASSQ